MKALGFCNSGIEGPCRPCYFEQFLSFFFFVGGGGHATEYYSTEPSRVVVIMTHVSRLSNWAQGSRILGPETRGRASVLLFR